MYSLTANNPDFILVSKNAGANFHKGNAAMGLVMKLRFDLDLRELYPVHRLDNMTSGLILFARHKDIAADLCLQFRNHSIEKFYVALAGTHPKKKQGMIKGDMIRGRNGEWILSRTMENPAITQFFSTGLGNGLRLYILKPHTGRTHQIRVALKSLGEPVFGDPIYYRAANAPFFSDRGYLHSYALQFKIRGHIHRFINPPVEGLQFNTDEFKAGLAKFKDPWTLDWPKVK